MYITFQFKQTKVNIVRSFENKLVCFASPKNLISVFFPEINSTRINLNQS